MSGIAQLPVEQVVKGVAPFYAIRLVALLLITYVPALSLMLVRRWRPECPSNLRPVRKVLLRP
jgi:TRAP-type C4-dicarboxylate transport system permease large subunit